MTYKVLAHIVTHESPECVLAAISSTLTQNIPAVVREDFAISLEITDNNSTNHIPDEIERIYGDRVALFRNHSNLGFCGAHNQAVNRFLHGDFDFLFLLNPDLRLDPNCLGNLIAALIKDPEIGSACPKLIRGDDELHPIVPTIIDAAGMEMTNSLRHLDRGSGQLDLANYEKEEMVFGGSAACLLLSRAFVQDAIVDESVGRESLFQIYPQLEEGYQTRSQLFDEAFFAYREDADLAWRGQILGWKCAYVPTASAIHRRRVVPENRATLPDEINLLGVKNRFLLQFNNYSYVSIPGAIIPGLILRNFLVIAAVLIKERSSINGIFQAARLAKRALYRRGIVKRKVRLRAKNASADLPISSWFNCKNA